MKAKYLLIIVLAAAILGGVGYGILAKTGLIKTFQIAYEIQQKDAAGNDDKRILEQLKKIILLPEDIQPTMAVITDVDALKKQRADFFVNAKNGDRMIVYPDLAIIYDVAANKIIKVGLVEQPAAGTNK